MDGSPHGGKIRAALEELLNWPPIARSPQLAKFLTYIVTATLEGQDAQIKAYSIAVDVFGRPASFDPQSDPIVRVQARRLRALLDQYYAEGNGSAGVRIQLPVGRYVPEFSFPDLLPEDEGPAEDAVRQPEAEPTAGRRPGRMAQALFAGLAMLAIGLGLLAFSQRAGGEVAGLPPEEPVLIVGQFSDLTDASGLDSFGSQLSAAIRASLAPFEDIRTMPTDPTPGTTSMPPGTYLLSGVVHTVASGIEITAMLSNGASKTLWTATFARPMPQSGEIGAVSTAARTIARELAPFRGPLHAAGRTWLDEQPRPLSRVNTYVCLIAYYLARESGSSTQIADALACNERLLKEQPLNALTLATSAWLEMRAIVATAGPARSLTTQLDGQLAMAQRAVALAPDSSIAHEHLGTVNNWRGHFEEAARDFERSLELNPLNTDARAGYGIMLGRSSQWLLANQQASIAITDTPYAPAWYYFPVTIYDFRERRFADALETARDTMQFGGGELGAIMAVAAAQELGREDVVEELQPRLMAMESLRRSGIIPWFSLQIADQKLIAAVALDLERAGVPNAALTAPF